MSEQEKPKESFLQKSEKYSIPLVLFASVYSLYAVASMGSYPIGYPQRVYFLLMFLAVFGIMAKEYVDDKFQKQEKSRLILRSPAYPDEESKWECSVPTKVDFGDFCFITLALAGIPVAIYANSVKQAFDNWGWFWSVILALGSLNIYIARPKTVPFKFTVQPDSIEIREWNLTREIKLNDLEQLELTVKQFFETNTAKINLKFDIKDSPSFLSEFKDIPTESKNELIKLLKTNFAIQDVKE